MTIVGTNEIYHREDLVGQFWYMHFWVPNPPPHQSWIPPPPQAGGCPRQCGCPQWYGCLLVIAEDSKGPQRREANRRRHRLTEPTTKALCQPPPLRAGPTEGQNEQWREANRRRQRQTIRSRGLVPNPPPPPQSKDALPLCFARSMSHSLSLVSAKFTAAKLTRHQIPPPPPPALSRLLRPCTAGLVHLTASRCRRCPLSCRCPCVAVQRAAIAVRSTAGCRARPTRYNRFACPMSSFARSQLSRTASTGPRWGCGGAAPAAARRFWAQLVDRVGRRSLGIEGLQLRHNNGAPPVSRPATVLPVDHPILDTLRGFLRRTRRLRASRAPVPQPLSCRCVPGGGGGLCISFQILYKNFVRNLFGVFKDLSG